MLPEISTKRKFALLPGLLYILMQAFPIAIGPGKACLHDALVPVMCAMLLLDRKRQQFRGLSMVLLGGFFAISLVTLVCQQFLYDYASWRDALEWCIFAYMGILFLFYSKDLFTGRQCYILAYSLFSAVMLATAYESLACCLGWKSLFCYSSDQMASTAMSFLSRRFQFTMSNPNHFGIFAALPLALLYAGLRKAPIRRSAAWFLLPLFAAYCVPLAWSASKHCIIAFALMQGCLLEAFQLKSLWARISALAITLCLIALFETTVLFVTFPISAQAPYINTERGMYTIHQAAYLNLLKSGARHALIGTGPSQARHLYPQFADAAKAERILAHYNALPSLPSFIAFMDPHNEYLNLATLFGIPAALLLLAFLVSLAIRSRSLPFLLLIIAALGSCLWDDVLSKRAVWIIIPLLYPSSVHLGKPQGACPDTCERVL